MALTLGPDASDLSLSSAIETGPDELTVLAHGYDYELFVRVLGRGRADSVFSIPPPPAGGGSMTLDSLARGADGSFAVVRVPTAYPPTREDPAFLLRPGAPPVALAPWSTIVADGTPPCEGMRGHRMIVQTRQSWLATGPVTDLAETIMLARVRWNEERVCLEAVEAHALTHTLDFGTFDSTMVARFGKDAAGGHVMVSEGAELREPRSCTLGPAALRP
jgi:hypothetical protein